MLQIADLNQFAGINHYIAIEIIRIPNPNPNTCIFSVFGPQPAPLGKRVVVADGDLAAVANTPAALHPVLLPCRMPTAR
jgi:hypothetical protein